MRDEPALREHADEPLTQREPESRAQDGRRLFEPRDRQR